MPSSYTQYTVKDNDTIESIALNQLGDASLWVQIVMINGLEFPYVTAESNTDILQYRSVTATGNVTLSLNSAAASDIPVVQGTMLQVVRAGVRDNGDRTPRYYTTTGATITAGSTSVTIPIVCEAPGDWGNTLSGTVTGFVEDGQGNVYLNTGAVVVKPAVDAITNTAAITNGITKNIKTTGEAIFIPTIASNSLTTLQTTDLYELIGGSDLLVGDDGDFVVEQSTGDLALATGLLNIEQSFLARIATRRGAHQRYPWYGSNMDYYSGKSGKFNVQLTLQDIVATAQQDDRVESAAIINTYSSGSQLYADVELTPVGSNTSLVVKNIAIG